MRRTYITVITVITVFFCAVFTASGQSRSFRFGQWTEIYNSIIRELNNNYVDTLPVDRMYRAAIDAMMEELDPYTIYIPEEENDDFQMSLSNTYGGIGAIIHKTKDSNVIINEPYENSPAHKSGLVCGDEIVAIDGVPTKGLEIKESTDKMKGKPGTTVIFTVLKARTGETVDIPVIRERIHMPDVEYAGMVNDTTGYLLLSGFTEKASDDVKKEFINLKNQGMKKFVLDLRGNGGGLMGEAVNIVSMFVPRGSLVVTAKGKSKESTYEYRTSTEPIDTEIPVVVLIDSGSASASEIVAGALQDMDRATIMGKRSYGKGLVQNIRNLPYNGQMKVTTAKYYTPSGRCVQAIDYSNRNDDGSVGHIPDSLTKEFKTVSGRIVRDGGGITPDVDLEYKDYSRLVYALVLGGVIDQYVIDYCRRHDSIPEVDEFNFSDEDFEDFIKFAMTQEFDYRSSAKTYYDEMKKELEKDGLAESMESELEALEKALDIEKEQFIRLKKDEIIPFIEEELASRYWFQKARIQVRLRYDDQLKKALSSPVLF